MKISQENLKNHVFYDVKTGKLVRKKFDGRCMPDGYLGSLKQSGYMVARIESKSYRVHHLVWLYFHGRYPDKHIDHINGNRSDNRIENLRECSPSENHQNRSSNKNSKSKYLGVSWCSARRKWVARIKAADINKQLGYFGSEEDAYDAYLKAKEALHKFNPIPR